MGTSGGRWLGLALLVTGAVAQAQVGELLWEENFDSLDNWMTVEGNGSWGWGNGELQYYQSENAEIVELEPGNHGLRITARAESGPGIVDQWGNPLAYTSAKLTTQARVSVHFGMIECRVRVPDIDLGGWPAVWMLGTANYGWPAKGELDLMEMGHHESFRDLHDSHNGGDGSGSSTVNQMVAANALFYDVDSVTPENPSGASSLAWDPDDEFCRPYYSLDENITGRFLTYRLYWDDTELRFTVLDGESEHDLYASPFQLGESSSEFLEPFYFIINLAVGGALTDAWNLGDPGSGLPVSLPLPAEMDVDYLRVYEWNGLGSVQLGPPEQRGGTFGLYTDTTPVDDALLPDVDAHVYVWEGTLAEAEIEPWEGENVLAWSTTGAGWFGAGMMAVQPLNLFGFGEGNLCFRIQIPANVTFKVGIIDAWGNQSWVEFPANQTVYGLQRNGQWGQAVIPVEVIRGQWMDLRMLSYPFAILEEQGAQCSFALDDIYWEGGPDVAVEPLQPMARTAAFQLQGAWPNPFNPGTTISWSQQRDARVRLAVYDLAGREVQQLTDAPQAAGEHQLVWNAAGLPSGLYLIRLEAAGEVHVDKCLLLK